jgi:hypothetical protein
MSIKKREKASKWALLRDNLKASADTFGDGPAEEVDQGEGHKSKETNLSSKPKNSSASTLEKNMNVLTDYIKLMMQVAKLQTKWEKANVKYGEFQDALKQMVTQNDELIFQRRPV